MDYVLLYKNIMYINGVTRVESEQWGQYNLSQRAMFLYFISLIYYKNIKFFFFKLCVKNLIFILNF